MAIFFALVLSVSYYYTCVRVRIYFSFLLFVSYCRVCIAIRFYVTQARAEKHGRITLSLEVLRENSGK